MRTKCCLGILFMLVVPMLNLVDASDRWLHVRVEETGSDGEESVAVNIPLQLIEAILPAIQTDELMGGRFGWDEGEIEGIDLRQILRALRDAPDADYVTIKDHDESVRVAKEDGFLLVRVDEDQGDHVRVRLPLDVVEALLGSQDEGSIDLVAGLRALGEFDGGDLVTVESDDESVRIWIDSNQAGD